MRHVTPVSLCEVVIVRNRTGWILSALGVVIFSGHARLCAQVDGKAQEDSKAIKAMVERPQDRSKAAAKVAKSLGGKMIGFWYAFGEFDCAFLLEAPDNATVAALAMAIGAGGALSKVETTVLLDMKEAQDAMQKAAAASYNPPS